MRRPPPRAPTHLEKICLILCWHVEKPNGFYFLLKAWAGSCWAWVKVRTLGREGENGFEPGSPSLVCKGKQWWLHTPVEKKFTSPAKVAEQIANTATKLCSVDLNLG